VHHGSIDVVEAGDKRVPSEQGVCEASDERLEKLETSGEDYTFVDLSQHLEVSRSKRLINGVEKPLRVGA
jgi:hypothetical protein